MLTNTSKMQKKRTFSHVPSLIFMLLHESSRFLLICVLWLYAHILAWKAVRPWIQPWTTENSRENKDTLTSHLTINFHIHFYEQKIIIVFTISSSSRAFALVGCVMMDLEQYFPCANDMKHSTCPFNWINKQQQKGQETLTMLQFFAKLKIVFDRM